jgi:hypothetical protein
MHTIIIVGSRIDLVSIAKSIAWISCWRSEKWTWKRHSHVKSVSFFIHYCHFWLSNDNKIFMIQRWAVKLELALNDNGVKLSCGNCVTYFVVSGIYIKKILRFSSFFFRIKTFYHHLAHNSQPWSSKIDCLSCSMAYKVVSSWLYNTIQRDCSR